MANSPPDANNSRVTLAVVQRDIQHVIEKLDRYHQELCKELEDHEGRLRALEGQSRQGVWRDLGVFVAAIAAGVAGVVTGTKP